MPGSVIVGGARTPIGKLSGALKDIPAVDLGGIAISAALQRAGITGDQIEYVIMGQVIQAGNGQNRLRHCRHRLRRGFITSRSRSPTRLMATMAMSSATPG